MKLTCGQNVRHVFSSFLRFVMSLWFFVSRCRAVLSSFRDVTVCFVWPFVSFLGCFVSSLRFAVIDRARLGMSQGTLHDETTSQSFWFQVNFTLFNRKSECLSSFEMSNISPHGHKTVPTGHRAEWTQLNSSVALHLNWTIRTFVSTWISAMASQKNWLICSGTPSWCMLFGGVYITWLWSWLTGTKVLKRLWSQTFLLFLDKLCLIARVLTFRLIVVKPKPKLNHKIPLGAIENSKWKQPNCLKCGKKRATKSWLVLVLYLVCWEDGPITERSEAKPM